MVVRAVVQRVSSASVTVDGVAVGAVGPGLLVLLGVATGDTADEAERLAGKIARLRIFAAGTMASSTGPSSTPEARRSS